MKKFYIGLRIYLKKLFYLVEVEMEIIYFLRFFDLIVDFYGRCQRRNEICIFIFVSFYFCLFCFIFVFLTLALLGVNRSLIYSRKEK